MKARVEQLLPLGLMLLLGALTLWLKQLVEVSQPSVSAAKDDAPLAVVERFTVTQLDGAGNPDYRLSARRMEYYGEARMTELTEPHFVRNEKGATTNVSADRGRVDHDYRQAHFFGHVTLVRSAPHEPDLRVVTDYLHVLPDGEVARTDRRVTITQGGSSLTGFGMEYNRARGELRLLSEVRGTFDAPKK